MKNTKIFLSFLLIVLFAGAASAGFVFLTDRFYLWDDPFLSFGNMEFSDFDYSGFGWISVWGVMDDVTGDYGLWFDFVDGIADTGQQVETTLTYKMCVPLWLGYDEWIKDASMQISAYGEGDGGVKVKATIGKEFATLTCTALAYGDKPVDYAEFQPWFISVHTDIYVTGGTNGFCHLTTIRHLYSQIPEPMTISLLALGALALLRKRKV